MAEIIDRANEVVEQTIQAALANRPTNRGAVSAIYCEDCGEAIAEARRIAIVGCTKCADFRALPFRDATFAQVIFDPPHLARAGEHSWMGKKYGKLNTETWREDLRNGFSEAFRVLRPLGTLVFKWNETHIPVSQVLSLTTERPTIWQRTGKADKTHWILFLKGGVA